MSWDLLRDFLLGLPGPVFLSVGSGIVIDRPLYFLVVTAEEEVVYLRPLLPR
jgi:hypothetical protein